MGKKIKHAIFNPSAAVIYMAVLYRLEKVSDIPVFVIMTKDAAPNLSQIHNRMPVISRKEDALDWLCDGKTSDSEILLEYRAV